MSTSNTTTFNQTASQIITDTLCLLGVYGQGDTVSTNDFNFCLNILNKMIKGWEGRGIHLWCQSEGALFLTLGQQSYGIASADTDIAGDSPSINVSTATATGVTISLASTTGIKVNDNIGIQLDIGTIQWTTVTTINSTTQLTINNTLTSQSSAGNSIFSFTTRVDRPLMITNTRFYAQGGFERPIDIVGRDQFMMLPIKSQTGKANQAYYSPHVSDCTMYLWPVADSVGDCLKFSYVRRIQDFVASTDNPDLPQEWLETITYNLAVRVASSYGIATQKLNPDISTIAAQSLEMMEMFDAEPGSLHIVPNYDYGY
jgi:hypothetical protein